MWQTAADGDLSRGVRADAGLAGVAEDRLVDCRRINAAALQRRLRRGDTEVGSGQFRERAAELADRGANGGNQENVLFVQTLLLQFIPSAARDHWSGCDDRTLLRGCSIDASLRSA